MALTTISTLMRRALAVLLIATAGIAAAVVPNQPVHAGAQLGVAVTRGFNVYLTTATGGATHAVTTRGTGYAGYWYPWYSWSPDGKYLLLLRWHASGPTGTLFLADATGKVLRTLATPPIPTDFWPSWALDADQIAFVARQQVDRSYGGFRNIVMRMDVNGRTHPLFTYLSHEGCGGGTPDPAEQRYWQEVGFEGDAPRMSWSVTQGIAAYTASCAGGMNITDLHTGRTQSHPHWIEPALSLRGTLAVAAPRSASPPRPAVVLVNPHTGRILRVAGRGELPGWSPDGNSLYFIDRTQVRTLPARDTGGHPFPLPVFRSAVLRANADGGHAAPLFSTDAFALGPLNLVNSGQALIFSRVENDWNLWRHRSKNGTLPIGPGYTSPYFPRVDVMRWDRGGRLRVIESNAGRPVVQP
jgi:hypothetical protein